MKIAPETVERARAVPIETVARSIQGLKRNGKQLAGPCLACGGADRFWVDLQADRWRCRKCKEGGDVIALVQFIHGIDFSEAVQMLTNEPSKSNGHGRTESEPERVSVAHFDYIDEDGKLLRQVVRQQFKNRDGSWVLKNGKPKKEFPQGRPDPDKEGEWIWKVKGVREIPYRLLDLLASDRTEPVFIVEGEKCVDRLRKESLQATCSTEGAGKWKAEINKHFRDRIAWILPDNDEPGRKHALQVASNLHGIATEVKIVDLGGHLCEEGEDIVEFFDLSGFDAETLLNLGEKAPLFVPGPPDPNPEPGKKRARVRQLVLGRLSDVKPLAVKWLWPDRIPRKFVLFTGAPDTGKTLTAIDIAARITRGKNWPDNYGHAPLGSVVILTAEDGIADTIRPRLEAAGADLNRVYYLKSVIGEDGSRAIFSLQTDLAQLGNMIDDIGDVALAIVDPVTAYLGAGKIDTHKTADVRAVLSPLTEFADERSLTVLGITHPPKSVSGNAINAATGSLAFIAAARSAYLFSREEENGRTLMLPIKNNLGPRKDGLAFRIHQRIVADSIAAPHLDLDHEPVTVTANEVLAAESERTSGDRSALNEAMEFIRTELLRGSRSRRCSRAGAESRYFGRNFKASP